MVTGYVGLLVLGSRVRSIIELRPRNTSVCKGKASVVVECGRSSTHSALCYVEARIAVVVLVAVNVDDRVFGLGCAYYMRRHIEIKNK